MTDPRLDEDVVADLEEIAANNGRPSETKRSIATVVVGIALERAEFFHGPDGKAHATFMVGDHEETHHVRSMQFRSWLARCLYELEGRAPGTQALQDALQVLEGQAVYDGEEQSVSVRVGGGDEVIYLDLVRATGGLKLGAVRAAAARVATRPATAPTTLPDGKP